MTEFDYLVATGDDRVGALAFDPDLTGPQRNAPWNNKDVPLDGEALDLAEMLEAVRKLESADNRAS